MKEEKANFCAKVKQAVSDNFDASVAIYQAFEERRHFFETLTAELAQRIDLNRDSSVLDVGCGNGISARTLNERYGCRVLGVDLSPKMIALGQASCRNEQVRLVVGDGERLIELVGDERFDYVLYNASIFIFPDVEQTIHQAAGCLRPGGKIAFSFYPLLAGPSGEDLLLTAFERLGAPLPRARVITDYPQACQAVEMYCGPVRHHQWVRPLDVAFLKDFFSIPAQSASLFPGQPYEVRREKAAQLFEGLADMTDQGHIVWRIAEASKES